MTKYHPRLKLVHGYRVQDHPCYVRWLHIKDRCEKSTNPHYKNYGGRGISICKEWSESFEMFALAIGLPPSTDHTIDRINNNKGYYPDNCKWSTRSEQCLNRRLFVNNKSGVTGVVKKANGSFTARYDFEKIRYYLGNFKTLNDAIQYRNDFINLFRKNKQDALKTLKPRVRLNSTTGFKNITKCGKGYMVRFTLANRVRKYICVSKTIQEAVEKLKQIESENDKI